MSEGASFVAAVRADPHDDGPRLVYADWLDGNGEAERARFVRLQCEASRRPWGTRSRIELDREADDLRREHEDHWLGPWRDRLVRWRWRRGFLEKATITASTFDAHGSDLFEQHVVDRIGFVDDVGNPISEAVVPDVVGHPAFVHVRSLDILGATPVRSAYGSWHSDFRDPPIPAATWLRCLAGDERLTEFRAFLPGGRLRLFNEFTENSGIDPTAVESFCRAPHLANVDTLDLQGCPLATSTGRDRVAGLVAEAPFANRLVRLGLEAWGLTDEAILRIAGDSVFGNVRKLDVDGYGGRFTPAGRQALFTSDTLRSLQTASIDETELAAYAESPLARRAQTLAIAGDDGEPNREAWDRLVRNGRRPTRLEFVCYDPGRDVMHNLRRSPWLRRLRTFVIRNDSQSPGIDRTEDVAHLLRSNSMPRLTRLLLHEFADGRFVDAIRRWRGLGRLERLELTDDYFGRFPSELLDAEPFASRIETLRGMLITSESDVDRFAASATTGVREIDLGFAVDLDVQAIERLFAVPVFRDVETARLGFNPYDQESAGMPGKVYHVLANPNALPRLRTLLTWQEDDAGGFEALRHRLGPGLKD